MLFPSPHECLNCRHSGPIVSQLALACLKVGFGPTAKARLDCCHQTKPSAAMNEGLVAFKEGFGGSAITRDFYEVDLLGLSSPVSVAKHES